ncbi:hypothetical protein B0O99DRAFT_630324 [Bisporella sp. PMI_857]|nr:hypothetical protein B0O99DRAFT_630324 [Bisporella sp. PMI_857]
MTCIPLSMEYPYVRNTTHEGLTTYYYYYGERIRREYDPPKSTSYTHNTSGDPFDSLAPVYEVHTYTTGLFEENSYWIPIPELAFPAHSTLSIMFISSLRILYLKRSADPLFPADKPKYLSDNQEPWFYNSDPRARPIACIDRTELYSPDGKQHWAMTENPSKDASKHPEYWLTLLSFLSSNMYDSVAKRLGSSFLAQKMVSQYQSHPLGDDHWVKEMKNIFATSLARAQIDTWSIASGEDSKHVGKDGYVPWTPDEAGNLCGLFKYRPSGHAYIKVIPFIGIILVLPFLFFVSRTMSEIKGWVCCGSRATKSSTPKELEPQAQLPSMNNNLSHALPEDGITEATEDEDTTRPEHSEEQQELADENEGEDLSLDGGQQNMTEESNDVPLRDLGDHTQRPADAIEGGLSDPYISSHGQARPGTFRSQEPSTHPPQAAAAVDLPAPRNSLWPSAMPSQPSQSKRRSKVHPDWELWEPLVIHIPFILIKRWLSNHPEENHSDESES